MSKMTPSIFQEEIFKTFRDTEYNMLINAVAGSGKTTTLIYLLKLALKKNIEANRILFLAFNKSIADELSTRVPQGICTSTFHALGFKMLRKAYRNVKLEKSKVTFLFFTLGLNQILNLDEETLYKVDKVLAEYRLRSYNNYDELDGLMSSHDLKIDFKDAVIQIHEEISTYNREFSSKSSEEFIIDFTDMIYLPNFLNLGSDTFDYVFIDECQDLNKLQHYIIDKVSHNKTRLVYVGDDRQAIYAFMGADSESYNGIKQKPNMIELPLSCSYRCAKSIVNHANIFNEKIESLDSKGDGILSTSYRNTITVMIDKVKNEQLLENNKIVYVICRNNLPLFKAYRRLSLAKVDAYIKGDDTLQQLITIIIRMNCKKTSELIKKLEHNLQEYADKIVTNSKGKLSYDDLNTNMGYVVLKERLAIISYIVETFEISSTFTLVNELKVMFTPKTDNPITLMSIHKSKGLEADVVFIFRPELIPSPMCGSVVDFQQERNLHYVAITRAKEELFYIYDAEDFNEEERKFFESQIKKPYASSPLKEIETQRKAKTVDVNLHSKKRTRTYDEF